MKKFFGLLIVLIIFFSLFGCVNESDSTDENTTPLLTNQSEVDLVTSDIGTDLSGINNTLEDIDSVLSE
jgi:PBP1b-binding outer membrane lipoprotein LpoB